MGKSCPDTQLLSVYFDGEMPSPWKEKMEGHVSGCPVCKKRLETYRFISRAPATADAAVSDEARERVWQKLELSLGEAKPASPSLPITRRRQLWWRKRLSVPIPAAAAAAAILLFVSAFILFRNNPVEEKVPFMTLASEAELDVPGIIPVSDMESVLQYLNVRDSGEVLIIRLPESRNFINYGEPAVIKAADYTRNQGWR